LEHRREKGGIPLSTLVFVCFKLAYADTIRAAIESAIERKTEKRFQNFAVR
jgi:hypothetical protein